MVLAMGDLVREQIAHAIKALQTGDGALASETISRDYEVNDYEVRIEEECFSILARRQPAAGDLRSVMTINKTIADLERMGDKAAKIADMTLAMDHGPCSAGHALARDIDSMAKHALDMLHRAMDALAQADAEVAIEVAMSEEMLNQEYHSAMRRLITYMLEDPHVITQAIDVLFIAGAIERTGEHARNICEYVVYLAKGKNVRHLPIEQVAESLQKD